MVVVGLGLMVILEHIEIGKAVKLSKNSKILSFLGFPSNETTKNCVVFDAQTGSWSNKDCDNSYCYICQQYI
jgi:hypothetical protein